MTKKDFIVLMYYLSLSNESNERDLSSFTCDLNSEEILEYIMFLEKISLLELDKSYEYRMTGFFDIKVIDILNDYGINCDILDDNKGLYEKAKQYLDSKCINVSGLSYGMNCGLFFSMDKDILRKIGDYSYSCLLINRNKKDFKYEINISNDFKIERSRNIYDDGRAIITPGGYLVKV